MYDGHREPSYLTDNSITIVTDGLESENTYRTYFYVYIWKYNGCGRHSEHHFSFSFRIAAVIVDPEDNLFTGTLAHFLNPVWKVHYSCSIIDHFFSLICKGKLYNESWRAVWQVTMNCTLLRTCISDEVLGFAPRMFCSFSKVSRGSKQCPNMFCKYMYICNKQLVFTCA